MRGKLQMEWDLACNSMYKLIILLTFLYSNQSLPCFFSYQCNSYKQHFIIRWAWSMGVPIEWHD